MKRRVAWLGWPALLLVLLGWIVALSGFVPRGNMVQLDEVGAHLRHGLRIVGFACLVIGSALAVMVGVRVPVLMILGGVVMNLSYEGRVLQQPIAGVLGASLVLLGCLWGSRVVRRLRDEEAGTAPSEPGPKDRA